ncbi:Tfp pilus assembly protein PilW [Legionella wadsworthii]|uniref:Tfp pilus assembly protein PilW n=1 Tax=Legionella wadsworthii TaxID=28088 RepID=A0A378M024_9GAMM|nr:hypothetical protein [Legionella wadsworthii]STY29671.1 Tfp pilus assembly protein PilW [Legionella wadsworthii]
MNIQRGISLAELLISLFLASVMMLILIQLYLNSKKEYLEIEKTLERQFDLQWVSNLISDSIRRAGFTPCLSIDRLQIIDHRNHQNKIQSLRIQNEPNPIVQVNRMNEQFSKIIQIHGAKILVQNPAKVHKNRLLLIADCEHAEVIDQFNIEKNKETSLITLGRPLFFMYDNAAYIGEFFEEKWFIKKNLQNKNTLHYTLLQTEEVTPLVHSMKVQVRRLKEKQLLQISMELEGKEKHQLKILVRGL